MLGTWLVVNHYSLYKMTCIYWTSNRSSFQFWTGLVQDWTAFLDRRRSVRGIFTCISYAEARNRYRLDVCLSVCLSVTRWYCIKTAEHIVMLYLPHDSPFILVLCVSRYSRNSDGVTPCRGTKYRWGIKICAIF